MSRYLVFAGDEHYGRAYPRDVGDDYDAIVAKLSVVPDTYFHAAQPEQKIRRGQMITTGTEFRDPNEILTIPAVEAWIEYRWPDDYAEIYDVDTQLMQRVDFDRRSSDPTFSDWTPIFP